jgi:hypothetical protein
MIYAANPEINYIIRSGASDTGLPMPKSALEPNIRNYCKGSPEYAVQINITTMSNTIS